MCLLVDYELHLIHLYILYCVPFSSACFAISLGSSPVSWPVSGTQCDLKMGCCGGGSECRYSWKGGSGEPSLCLIVSAEKDVQEAVSPAPDFSSDKT